MLEAECINRPVDNPSYRLIRRCMLQIPTYKESFSTKIGLTADHRHALLARWQSRGLIDLNDHFSRKPKGVGLAAINVQPMMIRRGHFILRNAQGAISLLAATMHACHHRQAWVVDISPQSGRSCPWWLRPTGVLCTNEFLLDLGGFYNDQKHYLYGAATCATGIWLLRQASCSGLPPHWAWRDYVGLTRGWSPLQAPPRWLPDSAQ